LEGPTLEFTKAIFYIFDIRGFGFGESEIFCHLIKSTLIHKSIEPMPPFLPNKN